MGTAVTDRNDGNNEAAWLERPLMVHYLTREARCCPVVLRSWAQSSWVSHTDGNRKKSPLCPTQEVEAPSNSSVLFLPQWAPAHKLTAESGSTGNSWARCLLGPFLGCIPILLLNCVWLESPRTCSCMVKKRDTSSVQNSLKGRHGHMAGC